MICPKCGFEQPDGGLDCMRCGIIFSRYKGNTTTGSIAVQAPFVPPPPLPPLPPLPQPPPVPSGVDFTATAAPTPVFATPPPLPAGSGLLYGAPAAAGGTVYTGPPAVPAPGGGTIYGGPGNTGVAPRPLLGGPMMVEISVGSVLGQTFSIFFSNLVAFLIISSVVALPIFIGLYFFFAWLLGHANLPPNAGGVTQMAGTFAFLFAALVSSPFATAALTYGVFQEMRKRSATIVDCLQVGLASLLPVVGVAILQGLAVVAGLIFCIIPGIILNAMLAVSVPAAVEEHPGVVGALQRSAFLTAGYRWQVFLVLFVLGILSNVASTIASMISVGVGLNPSGNLLTFAVQIVMTGIGATAMAVMYYRLRSAKESIGVEDIVSVFD